MAYGGIAVHKKQRQIGLLTEAGARLPRGPNLAKRKTSAHRDPLSLHRLHRTHQDAQGSMHPQQPRDAPGVKRHRCFEGNRVEVVQVDGVHRCV